MSSAIETFDISRATIYDSPRFKPFYPNQYQPLSEVREKGEIKAEQRLLVAQIGAEVLALDLHQMSYHHVAQGKLAGEHWLVAF